MTTFAPSPANANAQVRPIPDPAPVTKPAFPLNFRSIPTSFSLSSEHGQNIEFNSSRQL
jgi:hypothetical protein